MYIVVISLVLIIILTLYLRLKRKYKELASSKKSLSTKYGKMAEQFLPFIKTYPYNENNFRFMGSPIDGVQFEEDKVIFIEFKTSNSKLTKKQKHIRELVRKGKTEFKEFRI